MNFRSNLKYFLGALLPALTLWSCGDDVELPATNTGSATDGDHFICISVMPLEGEEVAYDDDNEGLDSRLYTAMTTDRENKIRSLGIVQFDTEGNMREMGSSGVRHLFTRFDEEQVNGYTRITDDDWSDLLLLNTEKTLRTCVIANLNEVDFLDIVYKDGNTSTPVSWDEFQEAKIELKYAQASDILIDNKLEIGHLTQTPMFGYYEGVLPSWGTTIGLSRLVAQLKLQIKASNPHWVKRSWAIYGAMHNVERETYFMVHDVNTPHVHRDLDAPILLDEHIDLTSANGGYIYYYSAPHVGSVTAEDATSVNLWFVEMNSDGTSTAPSWDDPHITIPIGNDPDHDDYTLTRNTIYSYTVTIPFNEPDDAAYAALEVADEGGADLPTGFRVVQTFAEGQGNAIIEIDGTALAEVYGTANSFDLCSLLKGTLVDQVKAGGEGIEFVVADYVEQPNTQAQNKLSLLQSSLSGHNFNFTEKPHTNFLTTADDGGFSFNILGDYKWMLTIRIKDPLADITSWNGGVNWADGGTTMQNVFVETRANCTDNNWNNGTDTYNLGIGVNEGIDLQKIMACEWSTDGERVTKHQYAYPRRDNPTDYNYPSEFRKFVVKTTDDTEVLKYSEETKHIEVSEFGKKWEGKVVWYARQMVCECFDAKTAGYEMTLVNESNDPITSTPLTNGTNIGLVEVGNDALDPNTVRYGSYGYTQYWWGDYTDAQLLTVKENKPRLMTDFGIEVSDDGILSTGENYTGFYFCLQVNAYFDYFYGVKRLGDNASWALIQFNRFCMPEGVKFPVKATYAIPEAWGYGDHYHED